MKDIMPVNVFTVKSPLPVPNLENELTKLKISTVFEPSICRMDIWNVSWMKNEKRQSITVLLGIYPSTRLIYGMTNAIKILHTR